jgi:hypothetical protein
MNLKNLSVRLRLLKLKIPIVTEETVTTKEATELKKKHFL